MYEWYWAVAAVFWGLAFFGFIGAVFNMVDDHSNYRGHDAKNARIVLLTIFLVPIAGFVWPLVAVGLIALGLGYLVKTAFPTKDKDN